MAVPMVSSAKRIIFVVLQRCVASFRVAGMALCDIPTCFMSKVVLRGRPKTIATFSEDALHFSWQAQHFGDLHRHFLWQAQHLKRVVLRGFCESNCHGGAKRCQGANSVAGVAFCII